MFCKKCDAANTANAVFCKNCGAPLATDTAGELSLAKKLTVTQPTVEEATKTSGIFPLPRIFKNRKTLAILGAGLVVAVIVFAMIIPAAAGSTAAVDAKGPDGAILDREGIELLYLEASNDAAKGRYLEAIDKLSYIPANHSRYQDAQSLISQAEISFIEDVVSTADGFVANGDFPAALEEIQNNLEIMPGNSTLLAELNRIGVAYRDSFLAGANTLADENEFPQAINIIDDGLLVFPGDSGFQEARTGLVDRYRGFLLENARSDRVDENYSGALGWLSESNDLFADDVDFLAELAMVSALQRIARGNIEFAITDLRKQAGEIGGNELMSFLKETEEGYLRAFKERYDSYISDGDFANAFLSVGVAITAFPDDAALMRVHGDALDMLIDHAFEGIDTAMSTGDYSEFESLLALLAVANSDERAFEMEAEFVASYINYVFEASGAMQNAGNHEEAVLLFIDSMDRLPASIDLVAGYRDAVISHAAAVFRAGRDYNAASLILQNTTDALSGDEAIAAEIERYLDFSPVALFRKGTITNAMAAETLIPRTRSEVEAIFEMLYISNLNETNYPRMPVYDQAARDFLTQVKAAYDRPSDVTPFLYDFNQTTRVVSSGFTSYELFEEVYQNINETNRNNIFYRMDLTGSWNSHMADTQIKLGTDFSFSTGGINFHAEWSNYRFIGAKHELIKPTNGTASGGISKFVVNVDEGYIVFVDDSEDAGILFVGTDDAGMIVMNGMMVDRSTPSSYLSVRYTTITQR